MLAEVDVLVPSSADEAIAAFGDGSGVTVVGGGTIVMPEVAAARLRPAKALLLGKAGLSGVSRAGGKVTRKTAPWRACGKVHSRSKARP